MFLKLTDKMGIMLDLQNDFKNHILPNGIPVRIKHYTGSVSATDFDDAQVLSQSGTDVWTTGLVLPITSARGSFEALLLEQGKIKTGDKRIYIAGDVVTSTLMKIGVGSPVNDENSLIPDGITFYPPVGDIVYKKIFARVLASGSLSGE